MIKKYAVWYVLTILLTGPLFLPHLIWEDSVIAFTMFAPLLATLLLLRLWKDRDAVSEIKSGLRFGVRHIHWYALSAVIPFVLVGISALLHTAIYDSAYHAWSGTPISHVLRIIALLLGSIGEEVGWRGYLQPSLSKKLSPFVSSIIVGFLWGVWHLTYAADPVFWLLFIVTAIELSILFAFLLNRANGNLWTAIIFHTVLNVSFRMFLWERFDRELMLIQIVLFGLACAVVLVLDRKRMFGRQTEKGAAIK